MGTCSALARSLHEQLAGTAPVAATWIGIEQTGPWGPRAFTESHLDPQTGSSIQRWAEGTGVKPVLIRRPGPHADRHQSSRRTVLLAHTAPGASWLLRCSLDDPAEVLDWDAAALGRGERPALGTVEGGVVALVCTNGRRDRCCAIHGRALAESLSELHPGRVWECTHLGGHRFAPTALLLPAGLVYGQLDAGSAETAWQAAGRGELELTGLRGRSWLSPAAQAADDDVRRAMGITQISHVTLTDPDRLASGDWIVTVSHVDGRCWQVTVRSERVSPARPESCGKAAIEPRQWRVVARHPC